MSGVTGNPSIKSRGVFEEIFKEYKNDLMEIPGIDNVQISGSYISNLKKTEFGDMDLIITVNGTDKKRIKSDLAKILMNHSGTRPFESVKYKGKKFYNSGEIITISYQKTGYPPCQIDNIIATSKTEANFKLNFLNLPAEKQGLLLGLMKVVFIENWKENITHEKNTEYSFNLSSKELQLRKVYYYTGTYKEEKRDIIETYVDWSEVLKLIPFNFDESFEELVNQCKSLKPRSKMRIKGVFKSMVSIKSGEVNKPKGARKQYALDIIKQL